MIIDKFGRTDGIDSFLVGTLRRDAPVSGFFLIIRSAKRNELDETLDMVF